MNDYISSLNDVKNLYEQIIEITSNFSLLSVVCILSVLILVFWPKGGNKNEN